MISITGGLQAMYNSNMREKTPLELEQELSQAKCRIRDLLKSETEYKLENERLHNIINETKDKLNTQLAFTSSYQLNYQSAMYLIEEAKKILDKENKYVKYDKKI